MKNYLCFLFLLLIQSAAIAQVRPQYLEISRLVAEGSTTEQTAMSTIVASHGINQRATVRYQAGQSISLQPGFVAQAGSVFSATIGPVGSLQATSEEPGFSLQAFPNPFRGQTTIEYTLPGSSGGLRYTLLDARGQVLRQSEQPAGLPAGRYQLQVEGGNLPTGVYLYQLEVGGQSRIIRLLKQQ